MSIDLTTTAQAFKDFVAGGRDLVLVVLIAFGVCNLETVLGQLRKSGVTSATVGPLAFDIEQMIDEMEQQASSEEELRFVLESQRVALTEAQTQLTTLSQLLAEAEPDARRGAVPTPERRADAARKITQLSERLDDVQSDTHRAVKRLDTVKKTRENLSRELERARQQAVDPSSPAPEVLEGGRLPSVRPSQAGPGPSPAE